MIPAAESGGHAPMKGFTEQLLDYFDRPGGHRPDGPIGGAAAWRGSTVDDRWRVELTDAQRDEVREMVRRITADGTPLAGLTIADVPLPTFTDAVESWRSELTDGRGFVVVSGFPVAEWTLEESELACWAMGLHLGVPGAQNLEGDLLGHVRDAGAERSHDHERLYRTNQAIRFHCDAADVVGLLCRSTPTTGGASRLVSSVAVHDILRCEAPDLADRLFEEMLLDARLPAGSEVTVVPVTPAVFDGERLRTFMHLDYFESAERHDGIELDDRARRALGAWEEIADRPDVHLDMQLAQGDLQLVSNHVIVHGRTAYVDDPTAPRDLLRLWLSLEHLP